jgi:tRNA-specific 2-thiouridylase
MSQTVLVAMSGGVDSSVAALLLLQQGYRVVGVTLRLHDSCGSPGAKRCCGLEDTFDAREVARALGIEHRVLEHQEAFRRLVVKPFVEAYARGETPNPCILCNERVKFGTLWEYARELGAAWVATGHHARMVHGDGPSRLKRGRDPAKDQSYVLFPLTEQQRGRTLLPVGEWTKEEIRAKARGLGLVTADKPESQDICFVGPAGYAEVVERELETFRPGIVRYLDGRPLGAHTGIHRFTVGQRRGLAIPWSEALYVTAIDAEAAEVTVGPKEALDVRRFVVGDWIWHAAEGERPAEAWVQVRYHQPPQRARLVEAGEAVMIEWLDGAGAVTPGQAAVAYLGETVVGGGWIRGRVA